MTELEKSTINNNLLKETSNLPFEKYLEDFGLPSQNIIATPREKAILSEQLPGFLSSIPEQHRKNAHYLSKFVSSVAIGRFDSALNDLWNEVIEVIRKKIINFGVDSFYDSAIGGNRRELYSGIDDLPLVKDNTLLDTCKKLELISNITYLKLSHILDMRNHIGGSHPTREIISPYNLMSWLDDAINSVLLDETSENSIYIQKIIKNIEESHITDDNYEEQLGQKLDDLSLQLTNQFLTIIFQKFVNSKSSILTENIKRIAPTVWNHADDSTKYELGNKLENLSINLENQKLEQGKIFFNLCDGNNYKSTSSRSSTLFNLADKLLLAHNDFDNFYNEFPVIREIMSYIKSSEDIPLEVQNQLIKVLTICRIGNFYGVSNKSINDYNNFFKLLNESQIKIVLKTLHDESINIQNKTMEKNLLSIIELINETIFSSDRVKETIEYLINDNGIDLRNKIKTTHYSKLISTFI